MQDTAVALGAGDRAFLIENVMGGDVEGGGSFPPAELRARYGLRPGQPVMLYTGTFEPYQHFDDKNERTHGLWKLKTYRPSSSQASSWGMAPSAWRRQTSSSSLQNETNGPVCSRRRPLKSAIIVRT